MKKQSISGFYSDLEEDLLDRLLREAVLWLVFLQSRFEHSEDPMIEVSSRKLLSEIIEIYDIYFLSIAIS